MLRLHYTGDSVLMADDVGEALLRYARALADTHTSDIVSIPVIKEGGTVGIARFLLGPASQLYFTTVEDAVEAGADESVVEELNRRARRLQPSMAYSLEEPDSATSFDHDIGERTYGLGADSG